MLVYIYRKAAVFSHQIDDIGLKNENVRAKGSIKPKDRKTKVSYCKEFTKHFKGSLHLFPSFHNSTSIPVPDVLR